MEDTTRQESKTGKIVKLIVKIAITVACLWYVSGKIDLPKAGAAIGRANWFFLFLAMIVFVLSKLAAAIRLNIYFRDIHIRLGEWENIRLYWLGMFYNLFLPGSISGDAYKVILLKKRFDISYKKGSSAVLLDRFSGLLGLGILLAVYCVFVLPDTWMILLMVSGAIAAVAVLFLVISRWFPDFIPSRWPTLFWGIAVQGLQVISVYLILRALGLPLHQHEYIFLFLLSSMVSVLPLTIGGLGAREIVFLQGATYFGLVEETAILISLLFYLITLLSSAAGLVYVFRDPLLPAKKKTLMEG